ncbi:MAG: thiamine-phosphate kinase [Gemmatimonadaceae bacterium]
MMYDREIAFGPGEEFRAIRRMIRRLGPLAAGIGDDAALIHVPRGNTLAMSADTSVENVHFKRDWLTPDEIGYRSATGALSDLAAVGASGVGMLVSLTVPHDARGMLDGIADGIARASRAAEVRVYGGDTTAGATLSLTFSVFGNTRDAMPRDAARAGDRVYVTGMLGGPAAAVTAFNAGIEPRPEWRDRFAQPRARLKEARWLAGRGARAAIDISDGLIGDAGHVAAASNVRIDLHLDRVPTVVGVTALDASRSGEEYELVVTSPIPIDTHAFAERFGITLSEIGVVKDGHPGVKTLLSGKVVTVPKAGFDHFGAQ